MTIPMPPTMKCQKCGRLYTSTWMDPVCYICKRKEQKPIGKPPESYLKIHKLARQ